MRKNIKTRRTIISLICATIFMTQAITAYAAVCDCGCEKDFCIHWRDYSTEKEYFSTNGTSHRVEWDQICDCSQCYVIQKKHVVSYEPCQWINYTDLGHLASGNHKYRLICGICHGTYDVTVPCQGGQTGNHQTPW